MSGEKHAALSAQHWICAPSLEVASVRTCLPTSVLYSAHRASEWWEREIWQQWLMGILKSSSV